LIVGGYFTDADGTPAISIAQHNGSSWSAVGNGMGGSQSTVMTLGLYNGNLIAGGFFTSAGGITANHIASWNGTSWSALGTGIQNIVYSQTVYNGNLIAGGLFLSAGGTPANHIASWNGTTWSALGTGMAGPFYQYVNALTVYNGDLIAGGYFTQSGGITTNGMARWDGAAWSDMGGGLFYPANVYGAHTLCVYGSDLVVGGLFSSAGSVGAAHIAIWNSPITGLAETESGGRLSVYPNPSDDFIYVEHSSDSKVTDYSVFDQSGRMVLSGKVLPRYGRIDISALASGMYYIKLGSQPESMLSFIKK
jgi:hypothetical protein